MRTSTTPEDALAFTLQPFGSTPGALGLQLTGHLEWREEHLAVTYHLSGQLASVVVPATRAEPPLRRDGLWEHTCFELFLAAEGTRAYWEVNLAPNGPWNLYRLEDYRQGLAAVPDRDSLPFSVNASDQVLEVEMQLQLPRELALACRQRALLLGVTAVIEQRGGDRTFWALAHGGPEADFHRREDFLLRLDPPLGQGNR